MNGNHPQFPIIKVLLLLPLLPRTYHYHSHQVWPVPIFIKPTDGIWFEILDDAVYADGQTLCILRTFEELRVDLFEHSFRSAFAHSAFLEDHCTLAVNIFIQVGDVMRPVFQHLEPFLKVACLVCGNGENVYGFIKTSVCVEVAPESNADVLQERDDLVFFEVFGSSICVFSCSIS